MGLKEPRIKQDFARIKHDLMGAKLTVESLIERAAILASKKIPFVIDFEVYDLFSPGPHHVIFVSEDQEHGSLELEGEFVVLNTMKPGTGYLEEVLRDLNEKSYSPWVLEFTSDLRDLLNQISTRLEKYLARMEAHEFAPVKRRGPKPKMVSSRLLRKRAKGEFYPAENIQQTQQADGSSVLMFDLISTTSDNWKITVTLEKNNTYSVHMDEVDKNSPFTTAGLQFMKDAKDFIFGCLTSEFNSKVDALRMPPPKRYQYSDPQMVQLIQNDLSLMKQGVIAALEDGFRKFEPIS